MRFNQISTTMGWPFTIVYLALVISAFYLTFVSMPKAINSNDWPQVQGQVTNAELVQRKHTLKTGKPITVYSAKVHYQYTVDGKPYTNKQLQLADHDDSQKIELAINKQYPSGANVTVFYNPNKPSESVLQKGLSFGHILTGIFLLISIAAMAFSLYKNARNRKR